MGGEQVGENWEQENYKVLEIILSGAKNPRGVTQVLERQQDPSLRSG